MHMLDLHTIFQKDEIVSMLWCMQIVVTGLICIQGTIGDS